MSVYYFLEDDYLVLKDLVKNNVSEIKKAKLDMATAASQTSETWHDNFGFEDGARNLEKLMNYTQEMSLILEKCQIIKEDDDEVIGKVIFVSFNKTTQEKIIGSYLNLKNEHNKISYACPIAQEYIKKNYPDSKLKL